MDNSQITLSNRRNYLLNFREKKYKQKLTSLLLFYKYELISVNQRKKYIDNNTLAYCCGGYISNNQHLIIDIKLLDKYVYTGLPSEQANKKEQRKLNIEWNINNITVSSLINNVTII